jgi:predicted nucleotidyltransferase
MSREEQILKWISEGLARYSVELKGYRICLFGSRAKRTQRDRSDFDVGIYGAQPISLRTFFAIGDFLESLPTLYRIDWVDLNRASAAVRDDALKNALVIYE